MKQFYLLAAFIIYHLVFNIGEAKAQTAKVYRTGSLIGTYTTIAAASAAANKIGDSILLSPHIFKEYDIRMSGGQIWQGTMTISDTTIIDAEFKGRAILNSFATGRGCTLRDVIVTHGKSNIGGGIYFIGDSLLLKGNTIIRNNHASIEGGGLVAACHAYDNVKITANTSDSCGGGTVQIYTYDNVEISYNTAKYGGGVGGVNFRGWIVNSSPNVKIINNTATVRGGGLYIQTNFGKMTNGQIINNSAPVGAGIYKTAGLFSLNNAYIYNPKAGGGRQNEIWCYSNYSPSEGGVDITGAWLGSNDTTGLIGFSGGPFSIKVYGKHAIANWSINRGVTLTKKDTLFPVGAAFTYSDGSALPPNSCPWLKGNFMANKGTFLTPKPAISPMDTISSLYRSFGVAKGGTAGRSVDFVCNVDADTFRATRIVWGRDSTKLGIASAENYSVMIYPNPATNFINIDGVESGSSIALYDIFGKMITVFVSAQPDKTVMDISSFPAGNYILKITTKEGAEGSAKISKE